MHCFVENRGFLFKQLKAVTMDDYLVKYEALKQEAKQLMEKGAIQAYIRKLIELEQIDQLYKKCA